MSGVLQPALTAESTVSHVDCASHGVYCESRWATEACVDRHASLSRQSPVDGGGIWARAPTPRDRRDDAVLVDSANTLPSVLCNDKRPGDYARGDSPWKVQASVRRGSTIAIADRADIRRPPGAWKYCKRRKARGDAVRSIKLTGYHDALVLSKRSIA